MDVVTFDLSTGIKTVRSYTQQEINEFAGGTSASAEDVIRQQIAELESQQTDRRIREAALGIDGGWLARLNDQIEALRDQLKGQS